MTPLRRSPEGSWVPRRCCVVAVWVATLLSASRAGTAQTLDELRGPMVPPGHVAVGVNQTSFALERITVELGRQPFVGFDPPFYALIPFVTFGLPKSTQITFDGTYQIPTVRSYQVFADPASRREESWGVVSIRATVRVRPSARMALDATYLRGRSSYRFSFPSGNGPRGDLAAATHVLAVSGLWLSQRDESRPRGADLDGLIGPLLRHRRTKVEWEGLWRRYDSTNDTQEVIGPPAVHQALSTDSRLRLGVGYGLLKQLEVSGDGYWQPAYSVADAIRSGAGGVERDTDLSRRLFDVLGARMAARWRPVASLQAFGEATAEHQSVTYRPGSSGDSTDSYRQRRLTTGVSWLSRAPKRGGDLRADLNGIYRPLLERHQVRLDGVFHLRRSSGVNAEDVEETAWRVHGAVGVSSILQVGAYAGRFRQDRTSGVTLFPVGHSFGGTVTLRPRSHIEAYASYDYHPAAHIDDYPAFNLPRGSRLMSFYDLQKNAFEDDASLHIGLRVVF